MKKPSKKIKLSLNKETVRALSSQELRQAAGGAYGDPPGCGVTAIAPCRPPKPPVHHI